MKLDIIDFDSDAFFPGQYRQESKWYIEES